MTAPLHSIRIILVEPAGALNIGAVARVMKNMALQQLVLVQPRCNHLGEEARLMAVHAPEILEAARVVETLPQALVGCQRAIAATGRPHTPTFTLEHPRQVLPWLLAPTAPGSESALIFGPEDRGLNNAELNYAQRLVYIPANPTYPSLNLSQAVAICCYELYQSCTSQMQTEQQAECPTAPAANTSTASLDQLEGFYQQLEMLLLDVGYLYPHTANSRMHKLRRLLHRAMPTAEEVTMLRGVLSQMRWAIEQRQKVPPKQE